MQSGKRAEKILPLELFPISREDQMQLLMRVQVKLKPIEMLTGLGKYARGCETSRRERFCARS